MVYLFFLYWYQRQVLVKATRYCEPTPLLCLVFLLGWVRCNSKVRKHSIQGGGDNTSRSYLLTLPKNKNKSWKREKMSVFCAYFKTIMEDTKKADCLLCPDKLSSIMLNNAPLIWLIWQRILKLSTTLKFKENQHNQHCSRNSRNVKNNRANKHQCKILPS